MLQKHVVNGMKSGNFEEKTGKQDSTTTDVLLTLSKSGISLDKALEGPPPLSF